MTPGGTILFQRRRHGRWRPARIIRERDGLLEVICEGKIYPVIDGYRIRRAVSKR